VLFLAQQIKGQCHEATQSSEMINFKVKNMRETQDIPAWEFADYLCRKLDFLDSLQLE